MVASLLLGHSKKNPYPRSLLAEDANLTVGQLSRVIKYMRRKSEDNPDVFLKYYPLSSKKGYFLAVDYNDFAKPFATLYQWYRSVRRTIEPLRKKMDSLGIDWKKYLNCDGKKAENDDIEEINGDTSWFLDECQ